MSDWDYSRLSVVTPVIASVTPANLLCSIIWCFSVGDYGVVQTDKMICNFE